MHGRQSIASRNCKIFAIKGGSLLWLSLVSYRISEATHSTPIQFNSINFLICQQIVDISIRWLAILWHLSFSLFFLSFCCVSVCANFQFLKMLKRAKSSFAIQKPCALIKSNSKIFVPMCQKAFDRNLVAYQNESAALKKRWIQNLLTSVLIGFGGGFSVVLSHYIRHRIRWWPNSPNLSIDIHTEYAVYRWIAQVSWEKKLKRILTN